MRNDRRMKGPRVNNRKVIRKIALKTVKANHRKSMVVIAAIALCTFMFTALFTIGGSIVSKFQESTARQSGGTSDASIKNLTEDEYNRIAADSKLKEVSKRIYVGNGVNHELLKLYTEANYCDETSAKKGFCYPEVGHLPVKEDEITVSSLILQAFGMDARNTSEYELLIGSILPLQIETGKGIIEKEFRISGIYTGDRISMAQMILVSKAFQDKYSPTPTVSFYEDGSMETVDDLYGRICADIDFYFPFDVSGQTYKTVVRNGLPDNTEIGVNWASSVGTMDLTTVLLMITMLATFFVSGYLIISNVYRINIYTDIRSYGLLKTVGTSSRQLKNIVKWQSVYHAVPGIIMGVIGGLIVGSLLLPLVMSQLVFSETTDNKAVINVWVLAFSILFSYITVRLSVRKAVRLASKVTPIEALRYTENVSAYKTKKHNGKFTPVSFALRNVFREKKRCFYVVLSLALSLVVLNSVYTMIIGFDESKYISNYVKTDFSVADAITDNLGATGQTYDGVTDSFISELKKQDGILNIGNIYAEQYCYQELNDRDFARFKERLLDNENVDTWMRDLASYAAGDGEIEYLNESTGTVAKVYGMDDYAVRNLDFVQGKYDADKFKTGKYIIVNEYNNGGDKESNLVPYFLPGETIAVNNNAGETREYEVMATVSIPLSMRIQYYTDMDVNYVLPSEEFLDFFGNRTPMRTLVDTTDEAEPVIEKWMADYTSNVEPSLKYSSRAVYRKEFDGLIGMFKVVGGLLTTVLALIGILNLINTLVTSVLSRRLELAMLEAVGMTKRIQRTSICFEGIVYGGLTLIFGMILSSVFSVLLVKSIGTEMWFYTYRFTLMPIMIVIPVMLMVAVVIPVVIYSRTMKETVVERLRLADA